MNNTCPSCGSVYGVTPQHVGREFSCRKCGASLVVREGGLELAGGQTQAEGGEPLEENMGDTARVGQRTRHTRGASGIGDYLTFRKMIVPILIQVIFWLFTALFVIGGFFQIIAGFKAGFTLGYLAVLGGLVMLFVGPLAVRIYCEIIIVVFRINDTLTEIKNVLEKK